jgi:exosortase
MWRPRSKSGWLVTLPLLAGTFLLALHPAAWLVRTWRDPAYDSDGAFVAGAAAALLAWSASSPRTRPPGEERALAAALLGLVALVRLLGRVLAVNTLGALALAVDVLAVGLLAGVSSRQRPLSPLWLAAFFAFSLPVERIVQRVLGLALQHASAAGAAALLDVGFQDVRRIGTRIVLSGQDVLVDLPCSGARGLTVLLTLACAIAAVRRPTLVAGLVTLVASVGLGLAANVGRIALLAIGIAHGPALGIDVLQPPWHEGIGLACLAPAVVTLLAWAGRLRPSAAPTRAIAVPRSLLPSRRLAPAGACGFAALATVVVSVPQHPVDAAAPMAPVALPASLAGRPIAPRALSSREAEYFTLHGGAAACASYGEQSLLVVRTTAPLRHLHAPDECLAGAGHRVQLLSVVRGTPSAAVYRSVAPDGSTSRVRVTFASDRGQVATSVAEVTWWWLRDPGATWTSIQRASPWSTPPTQDQMFDAAVAAALDVPRKELTP